MMSAHRVRGSSLTVARNRLHRDRKRLISQGRTEVRGAHSHPA
jgi:hypothetical protein